MDGAVCTSIGACLLKLDERYATPDRHTRVAIPDLWHELFSLESTTQIRKGSIEGIKALLAQAKLSTPIDGRHYKASALKTIKHLLRFLIVSDEDSSSDLAEFIAHGERHFFSVDRSFCVITSALLDPEPVNLFNDSAQITPKDPIANITTYLNFLIEERFLDVCELGIRHFITSALKSIDYPGLMLVTSANEFLQARLAHHIPRLTLEFYKVMPITLLCKFAHAWIAINFEKASQDFLNEAQRTWLYKQLHDTILKDFEHHGFNLDDTDTHVKALVDQLKLNLQRDTLEVILGGSSYPFNSGSYGALSYLNSLNEHYAEHPVAKTLLKDLLATTKQDELVAIDSQAHMLKDFLDGRKQYIAARAQYKPTEPYTLKAIEDYVNAVDTITHRDMIVPLTEQLSAIITKLKPFIDSHSTGEYALFENFFAILQTNILFEHDPDYDDDMGWEFQATAFQSVSRLFEKTLFVTDEEIEANAKPDHYGNVDITVKSMNRILLHAMAISPARWTAGFKVALKTILDFLEKGELPGADIASSLLENYPRPLLNHLRKILNGELRLIDAQCEMNAFIRSLYLAGFLEIEQPYLQFLVHLIESYNAVGDKKQIQEQCHDLFMIGILSDLIPYTAKELYELHHLADTDWQEVLFEIYQNPIFVRKLGEHSSSCQLLFEPWNRISINVYNDPEEYDAIYHKIVYNPFRYGLSQGAIEGVTPGLLAAYRAYFRKFQSIEQIEKLFSLLVPRDIPTFIGQLEPIIYQQARELINLKNVREISDKIATLMSALTLLNHTLTGKYLQLDLLQHEHILDFLKTTGNIAKLLSACKQDTNFLRYITKAHHKKQYPLVKFDTHPEVLMQLTRTSDEGYEIVKKALASTNNITFVLTHQNMLLKNTSIFKNASDFGLWLQTITPQQTLHPQHHQFLFLNNLATKPDFLQYAVEYLLDNQFLWVPSLPKNHALFLLLSFLALLKEKGPDWGCIANQLSTIPESIDQNLVIFELAEKLQLDPGILTEFDEKHPQFEALKINFNIDKIHESNATLDYIVKVFIHYFSTESRVARWVEQATNISSRFNTIKKLLENDTEGHSALHLVTCMETRKVFFSTSFIAPLLETLITQPYFRGFMLTNSSLLQYWLTEANLAVSDNFLYDALLKTSKVFSPKFLLHCLYTSNSSLNASSYLSNTTYLLNGYVRSSDQLPQCYNNMVISSKADLIAFDLVYLQAQYCRISLVAFIDSLIRDNYFDRVLEQYLKKEIHQADLKRFVLFFVNASSEHASMVSIINNPAALLLLLIIAQHHPILNTQHAQTEYSRMIETNTSRLPEYRLFSLLDFEHFRLPVILDVCSILSYWLKHCKAAFFKTPENTRQFLKYCAATRRGLVSVDFLKKCARICSTFATYNGLVDATEMEKTSDVISALYQLDNVRHMLHLGSTPSFLNPADEQPTSIFKMWFTDPAAPTFFAYNPAALFDIYRHLKFDTERYPFILQYMDHADFVQQLFMKSTNLDEFMKLVQLVKNPTHIHFNKLSVLIKTASEYQQAHEALQACPGAKKHFLKLLENPLLIKKPDHRRTGESVTLHCNHSISL